jgi:hypothetical protein
MNAPATGHQSRRCEKLRWRQNNLTHMGSAVSLLNLAVSLGLNINLKPSYTIQFRS